MADSTHRFDSPYALIGLIGSDSMIGVLSGMPYVAAVELKTMRFVPAARIASRRAMPPATFSRKYLAGSVIDSPTRDLAAQCRTASIWRFWSSAVTAAISL